MIQTSNAFPQRYATGCVFVHATPSAPFDQEDVHEDELGTSGDDAPEIWCDVDADAEGEEDGALAGAEVDGDADPNEETAPAGEVLEPIGLDLAPRATPGTWTARRDLYYTIILMPLACPTPSGNVEV